MTSYANSARKSFAIAGFVLASIGIAVAAKSHLRHPHVKQGPSLAERLGYKATDRVLIVNCDDVGMCHSANLAHIDAIEKGLVTSATIMVPCPWFMEIAKYAKEHPDKDFGLHLTHTSEWQKYKWGPVAPKSEIPKLVDPQGYLWPNEEEIYKVSTPKEAEIEARAQIKKALAAGIDVTHLDSHMGALQRHPDYMQVYLKLGKEFNLPLRMANQELLERFGAPEFRAQATKMGIVFTDYLLHEEREYKLPVKEKFLKILNELKPGVSELYIHPGQRTEEMKAITGTWEERSEEADIFTSDPDIRQMIKDKNIHLIGYRKLRDLQRAAKAK
jgi:predicted glycoside hydrolase/deacetylase ChbG (UPF0249 family)